MTLDDAVAHALVVLSNPEGSARDRAAYRTLRSLLATIDRRDAERDRLCAVLVALDQRDAERSAELVAMRVAYEALARPCVPTVEVDAERTDRIPLETVEHLRALSTTKDLP